MAQRRRKASVTWPAGLAETPERLRWFARIGNLPDRLMQKEAARLLGVPIPTARRWLVQFGYRWPGTRHAAGVWDRVDWSLSDAEIGRRLGVHRQSASNQRKARGLPPSRGKGQRRPGPLARWVADHAAKLAGMTAGEVAAAYRKATGREAKLGMIYKLMRAAAVPTSELRGPRPPMPDPNWELPTRVLAEVWGLAFSTVQQYRASRQAGPPRWHHGSPIQTADPEYKSAVKAERAKARRAKYHAPPPL